MDKTNWTVAFASVTGNLHIKQNIPCQDSCTYRSLNENWGLGIVSDGAGSSTHAHIGSELTVNLADKHFTELIKTQGWHKDNTFPSEDLWNDVALLTLKKVRHDMEKLATEQGLTLQSLSSTVIVVIHCPFGLMTAHIGDGRAGYYNGVEWKSAITPFQGTFASETIFVTSDIWEEDTVRQYVKSGMIKEDVKAFVLMTDGCQKGSFEVNIYDPIKNKFSDPNRPFAKFFDPNVQGLHALYRDGKTQAEINQLWSGFLEKGTRQFKAEGDDKTMILGVQNPI